MNIKQTLHNLKEIEAQLYEFELSATDMTLEMHNLYKLIEQLMDLSFQSSDQDMKVKYALVENKARECYDCIKSRLAINN